MHRTNPKTERNSNRASSDDASADRYVWYKMQVMVEVDTLAGTVTRVLPLPGGTDEDCDDERYLVVGKPPT